MIYNAEIRNKINGKKCSKTAIYNIYNKYMVNGHYLY